MKTILLMVLLALVSCTDQNSNRQVIIEGLDTNEVYQTIQDKYQYLVRLKDGSVWLVTTCSFSPESKVLTKTQIFPAQPNP